MNSRTFRALVWGYYRANGRILPWRQTRDPYKIFVSEIMLQQTQVPRVIVKYPEFVKAFPSFRALAQASLRDVLNVWQGLGYNRRGVNLKQTAESVIRAYGGKLPQDPAELVKLSGIGRNTAASIAAFAFNLPVVFIETNIRSVFLHHFFADESGVHDRELLPFIEKTLDRGNAREWYYALMDYGTHLKKLHPNPSRKSAHHTRQSPFLDSHRRVRGLVLKTLLQKPRSEHLLVKAVGEERKRVAKAVRELVAEDIVVRKRGVLRVAE